MTAQVLFFNFLFEKDSHLNAVEPKKNCISIKNDCYIYLLGVYSMQGLTATTRRGMECQEKEAQND